MSDRSLNCSRLTSPASDSGTSSLESLAGATPCASPASPIPPTSGPDLVPVSPSVGLDSSADSMTNGIYGQPCTASLSSADLQSCLESRLQVLLQGRGSPLFVLTWKPQAMPSGPPICLLRASVPRTPGPANTSWPTPAASDGKIASQSGQRRGQLGDPAIWPTPRASDASKGALINNDRVGTTGHDLPTIASRASWGTPTAVTLRLGIALQAKGCKRR